MHWRAWIFNRENPLTIKVFHFMWKTARVKEAATPAYPIAQIKIPVKISTSALQSKKRARPLKREGGFCDSRVLQGDINVPTPPPFVLISRKCNNLWLKGKKWLIFLGSIYTLKKRALVQKIPFSTGQSDEGSGKRITTFFNYPTLSFPSGPILYIYV